LAEAESNLAAGEATTTTTLPPSNELALEPIATIYGDIAPKSIVATNHGLFFAQNMMYRHTVTVYDDSFELVATIPDEVEIGGEIYKGSPVEAVPTSDGAYVYVSNYRIYGPGYYRAGGDECDLGSWDESFVYRISTETLEIDQIIPAGAVPKFLAITPDDSTLLVTNWCSFDMSIIDTDAGDEIGRVELGRHPRGIAVTSDGGTAYVAVMGSSNIAVVDLATLEVGWMRSVGANPRHLVLDSTDRYLYATLNGDDRVICIDTRTAEVTHRIRTGDAPRSMAISDDDLTLYVVNYESDTMTRINARTMEILETFSVPPGPIGITFDDASRRVWVASYTGSITAFAHPASFQ